MRRTKIVKNLTNIFMVQFFPELIKSYTETTKSIKEKFTSKEASYTASQNNRRVELQKVCVKHFIKFLAKNFDFHLSNQFKY